MRITCDVEVMVQLIGACRVGGYAAIHSGHGGRHHGQDPHRLGRTQTRVQSNKKNTGWESLRPVIDFNYQLLYKRLLRVTAFLPLKADAFKATVSGEDQNRIFRHSS